MPRTKPEEPGPASLGYNRVNPVANQIARRAALPPQLPDRATVLPVEQVAERNTALGKVATLWPTLPAPRSRYIDTQPEQTIDSAYLNLNMASPADVRETGDDMFPAHLLTDNKSLLSALPEGYTMRPLSVNDYGNGFPEIFSVLTDVGDISKEAFEKRFREMQSIWGYYILVVLDGSKKIVGTGALVLEKKL